MNLVIGAFHIYGWIAIIGFPIMIQHWIAYERRMSKIDWAIGWDEGFDKGYDEALEAAANDALHTASIWGIADHQAEAVAKFIRSMKTDATTSKAKTS